MGIIRQTPYILSALICVLFCCCVGVYFETGSLSTCSWPSRLGWLINESQGFTCLHLPRDDTKTASHDTQLFVWILCLEPRFSCFHGKHFTTFALHTAKYS